MFIGFADLTSFGNQEYHLQAVLKGAGVAADQEIPVPPPQQSELDYDQFYPQKVAKTSTYIRFSQTVEECISCMYDMTEDDETFLKSYNMKLTPSARLSEDDFERIMDVYEDMAASITPFSAIDQTMPSYHEMLRGLQPLDSTKVMAHAKQIYEYWRERRTISKNKPLNPTLKFETHAESDELDPYVCFRRREIRQTRKTRARDVQSADKLKRLRKELEEGRQLILAVHNRELLKADMLKVERAIFDQRAIIKEQKLRLGIRTGDEDLVNQKVSQMATCVRLTSADANTSQQPQKRKAPEAPSAQRPPPPPQIRMPVRPDGRPAESDLVQLSDRLAEKNAELIIEIEKKIQNHIDWNKNYIDLTGKPLSPVQGPRQDLGFRPAKTQYLMTPPASASSGSMDEPTPMDLDKPISKPNPPPPVKFRGVAQDEQSLAHPPSYRRRIGRLNRLWIDRRGLPSPARDLNEEQSDRWKYDQSSDDEDDAPVYMLDPFDTKALRYRASIPLQTVTRPTPPVVNQRFIPPGAIPQQLAQVAQGALAPGQPGPQPQPQPQPHPPQLNQAQPLPIPLPQQPVVHPQPQPQPQAQPVS